MKIEAMTKYPNAEPDFVDTEAGQDCYRIRGAFGSKIVRVPSGTPVQTHSEHYRAAPSRRDSVQAHFENSYVSDDCLVIPLDDFVHRIVAGSDPAALARSLWSADENVCEEFMGALTNRYQDGSLSDAQRRQFLAKVQVEVWAAALDKAVERMEKHDDAQRSAFRLRDQSEALARVVDRLLEDLSEAASLDEFRASDAAEALALWHKRAVLENRDAEAVQKDWREARDFWRRAIVEKFPAPPCLDETPPPL